MKRVVATGRTVEEAVTSALVRLGATRTQVEVRVVQEPVKGLLGFIGGKDAQVEVALNLTPQDTAKQLLSDILIRMGVSAVVRMHPLEQAEGPGYLLEIVCDDESELSSVIGRHGAVLDALQYLVNVVVNKERTEFVKFQVDAGGYRARRRFGLERLADQAANRAVRTRRPVEMDSMPSVDRKVIHTRLQTRSDVTTSSEGVDPHRKVVITPVRSNRGKRSHGNSSHG